MTVEAEIVSARCRKTWDIRDVRKSALPRQSYVRLRPIADIKKNCHIMPMEIAVKAQKLLEISLEGSLG